ncbi:MAG: TssQ family T6SS-associated lipoprotein [Pseudomonadota bacterium]
MTIDQACRRWSAIVALALLTACAPLTPQPDTRAKAAAPLSTAEVEARYQQGLANYGASRYEAAIEDFNTAIGSDKLRQANVILARKHLAFIYCISNRQLQCREQFTALLQLEPTFTLAPNEASHPMWGPVWLSVKGVAEDKKAIERGNSFLASKSQEKLAEGMRAYTEGHYKEAAETLQEALKRGLPDKADQIRAHKYSAFAYCVSKLSAPCQAEFARIFQLDPDFVLLPSEAGHPDWRQAYRKEQTVALRAKKR